MTDRVMIGGNALRATDHGDGTHTLSSEALTDSQLRASRVPVRMLLGLGSAFTITSASATVPVPHGLSPGIKGVTIVARNSDGFFGFADGANPSAVSVVHYIAAGERLDIDLSGMANPRIAVLYGPASAAAIFHISELV